MRKNMFAGIVLLIAYFVKDSFAYQEQLIINSILNSNYSSMSRPTQTTNITFKLTLNQINSVDEKNQIVTTSFYLFVYWNDPRLTWDLSLYENVTTISVPMKKIWLPDLYVINAASPNGGYITVNDLSRAIVNYNGTVYCNFGFLSLGTRCPMNIYYFPYDKQTCSIIIGPWMMYNVDPSNNTVSMVRISIDQLYNFQSDLIHYVNNSVWDLKSTSKEIVSSGARFCDEVYSTDFLFNFTIHRNPLYYMIYNIYPSLVLNVITLITYFLPYNLQAGLSLTTFLNFGIITMRVSSDIPVTSMYLPLISLFLFLSISNTFLSFFWFFIAEKLKYINYKSEFLLNLIKKMKKISRNKSEHNEVEMPAEHEKKDEEQVNLTIFILNCTVFICMTLFMFIPYLAIWVAIFK